jgi:hypothetical protein
MFRNKLQGPSYFDDAASVLTRLLNKPSASQNLAAWEYNRTPPMPGEGQQNVLGKLLSMVPENVMFAANFLGPGVKPAMPAPKPQGIKAYHGSPHDFDQFSFAHIGKGEGNQAFGHGLYFAENEGVAKSYRDTLAPVATARGKPLTEDGLLELPVASSLGFGKMFDRLKELGTTQAIRNELAAVSGNSIDGISKARYLKILDDIDAAGLAPAKSGKMYEVNINANPEHFLDWDKPITQQPAAVQEALAKAGVQPYVTEKKASETYHRYVGDLYANRPSPDNLVGSWHEQSARDATAALKDAGIPGIKYLDQGSRVAGEGSRNYVVFDDKLIEILKKYGLVPPAVAAGAAALGNSDQQ